MKNNNKISIKYVFFILFMYLFIFQYLLQMYIPIFKYIDEIYALLFIPVFLFNKKKGIIKKYDLIIFLLLIIIVLTGLHQNFKLGFQTPRYYLSDLLIFLKFFFSVYLSRLIFDSDFFDKNKKKITVQLRAIIVFLFLLTIINYVFNIWPNSDVKFGFIMSNELFYGHPTGLAAVCFFILSLYYLHNKKIDKYTLLLFLIIITTFRSKALGALLISCLVVIYNRKTGKKISLNKIAILGIIVFMFFWNRIDSYFFTEGYARTELLKTSIVIAKDYNPLGTGFGTFASYYSAVSYSRVYQIYGISNIWGITETNYSFIADTFWATIIGQFGFLGLVFYIFIILYIYKTLQDEYSIKDKHLYIAKMISLIYLLVSSIAESAFMNPLSIPLGLIIGFSVKKDGGANNEKE